MKTLENQTQFYYLFQIEWLSWSETIIYKDSNRKSVKKYRIKGGGKQVVVEPNTS